MERSRLPTGVAPGSRVTTTSWPLPRIQSASASTCVDLPAPSPPSRAMKNPVADGACSGSPPRRASRRSRRSGTPPRSSALASTSAATGSSSAPTSIRVNEAPPWANTTRPPPTRCGPMAAARTGARTAPTATATRTTAWRCSVTRARRNSSVSWSSRVCPVLAATPAARPADSDRNSTVAVSGTSPASSSASPATAMASASSRAPRQPRQHLARLRGPNAQAGPADQGEDQQRVRGGAPAEVEGVQHRNGGGAGHRRGNGGAGRHEQRDGSGTALLRPVPRLGCAQPSSGDLGRGVFTSGSTSGNSSETDAANRPAAT